MTTLPHSPLTHAELNARWHAADDVPVLAALTAEHDAYLAVALARCEDGAA